MSSVVPRYEEKVMSGPLAGIKIVCRKRFSNDQWLEKPYFEGVRDFLLEEFYEMVDLPTTDVFFKNGYRCEVSEEVVELEVRVTKDSISITRQCEAFPCRKIFFKDNLPYRVTVFFRDFSSFKEAYNRVFEYVEGTWRYEIQSCIAKLDTRKAYPNNFNLMGEFPEDKEITLKPLV